MSEFVTYFQLGFEHIFNFRAYDHMVFVLVICAPFTHRQSKQILILLTAFTIGHSATLALSALDILTMDSAWVEFLIPVTIFMSAFLNLVDAAFRRRKRKLYESVQLNYFLAMFFGLIHGMGFSNGLRPLLSESDSLLSRLFSFNVGIEAGQILIALIILGLLIFTTRYLGVVHRKWNVWISIGVLILSLQMMLQTRFW